MEQDTFFQTASFQDVLDDLSCRFIVNIPAEELVSVSRICFQIEQAHWFYEDFIREQNPQLPSLSLRRFSKCIFDHCPLLWQFSGRHEEEYEDFLRYKQRVPVLGGILLDENWEKCILVKAWKGGSWSFPRGKINKDEPDTDCAIREVWEETGYDVSALLLPDAFLELQIKEQRVKLYIIPGVPTNTLMSPQTRKEISMIGWIRLVDLPGYSKRNKQVNPGIKLYMVTPFMSGLRKWISQNRHRKGKLVPVEEDGGESNVELPGDLAAETEEAGRTGELIEMLRRPQIQEKGVDLLGMLRNGTVTEAETEAPYPYPQHYLGLQDNFPSMLQESHVEPQLSHVQQQQLPSPPPMSGNQPFDSVRRNSLLSILKRGPQPTSAEDKTATPSLLDILKGPRSPPAPSFTTALNSNSRPDVMDPTKTEHQQSLLLALKSPTLPFADPTTSNIAPATVHQTRLPTTLKSPAIPQSAPPTSHHHSLLSALKSPPPSTTQGTPGTTHQNALLAALKSPPLPKTTPPPPPSLSALKSPSPEMAKSAPVSSHQNTLLSALKSPPVARNTPPPPPPPPPPTFTSVEQPTSVSTHENALLSALKSPPLTTNMPPPAAGPTYDVRPRAMSTHQNALLSALTSPPITKSKPPPSTAMQPRFDEAMPASIHKNALLSALKSPTLTQTAPLAIPTDQVVATEDRSSTHKNALMTALKSPPVQKSAPPNIDPIKDIIPPMAASAHQNALLTALKSPPLQKSVSPKQLAVESVDKPAETTSALKNALLAALTSPKLQPSKPQAVQSTHTTSLLDILKSPPLHKSTPSPALEVAGIAIPAPDFTSFDVVEEMPRMMSPPVPRVAPSPSYQDSLLSALKSPTLPGSPVRNEYQSSLLDVLRKSPPAAKDHQSSLLDALRGLGAGVQKEEGTTNVGVMDERAVKNVHVESLLGRLRSPSSSPTLEKSAPAATNITATTSSRTEQNAAPTVAATNGMKDNGSVMNRVLETVRNGNSRSTSPSQSMPSTQQQQRQKSPQRRQILGVTEPRKNGKSKIPTPTSPKIPTPTSSTSPAPTATTAQQRSLLSLLSPTKPVPSDTSATAANHAPSTKMDKGKESQQYNFSQTPQIGKRHTFRQVLTPSNVSDVDHKPNGTIDLGKVTLLRRPIPHPSETATPANTSQTTAAVPHTPSAIGQFVMSSKEGIKSPESPLGIEFPFKRRTPSRNVSVSGESRSGNGSPSPTVEKEKNQGNVQSLLSLFNGAPPEHEIPTSELEVKPPPKEQKEANIPQVKSEESTGDDKINFLLRAFRNPIPTPKPPKVEEKPVEEKQGLGTEREMKLVAMLERALAKGVGGSPS